jgi:uncharacterized protein (TIGR04255 family)
MKLAPSAGFSVIELARLHTTLSALYAGEPRVQQNIETDWAAGTGSDGCADIRSRYRIFQKTLFMAEDASRFVAVSTNEVSIHTLSPYDGWGPFRDRIARVLEACGDSEVPVHAHRIAVRYVNRVPFPAYNIPLSTYFAKAPEYPDGVPVAGMRSFLSRIECEYPDDTVRLTIVMGDVLPKTVGSPSFTLDLEVAWANMAEPLAVSAALSTIEGLKERVSVAFENSMTDEARRAFDAD